MQKWLSLHEFKHTHMHTEQGMHTRWSQLLLTKLPAQENRGKQSSRWEKQILFVSPVQQSTVKAELHKNTYTEEGGREGRVTIRRFKHPFCILSQLDTYPPCLALSQPDTEHTASKPVTTSCHKTHTVLTWHHSGVRISADLVERAAFKADVITSTCGYLHRTRCPKSQHRGQETSQAEMGRERKGCYHISYFTVWERGQQ